MSYWWCLDHRETEEGLGCGSTTRLGPYATREQAALALKRINAREAEQAEKDRSHEADRAARG